LPSGLYSSNPECLAHCRMNLQEQVMGAVAEELPQLAAHLLDLDLDTNLFLPRWLSCLFVTTLPAPAVLRLWDFLLAAEPCPSSKDAGTVLLRLTMALLARAAEALLGASDVGEALEVLNRTVQGVTTADVERMLVREWTVERFVRVSADTAHDGLNSASQGDVPSVADVAEDVREANGMVPSHDSRSHERVAAEAAKREALEETSTNASTSPCEVDGSSECLVHADARAQPVTFLSEERGCAAAE